MGVVVCSIDCAAAEGLDRTRFGTIYFGYRKRWICRWVIWVVSGFFGRFWVGGSVARPVCAVFSRLKAGTGRKAGAGHARTRSAGGSAHVRDPTGPDAGRAGPTGSPALDAMGVPVAGGRIVPAVAGAIRRRGPAGRASGRRGRRAPCPGRRPSDAAGDAGRARRRRPRHASGWRAHRTRGWHRPGPRGVPGRRPAGLDACMRISTCGVPDRRRGRIRMRPWTACGTGARGAGRERGDAARWNGFITGPVARGLTCVRPV